MVIRYVTSYRLATLVKRRRDAVLKDAESTGVRERLAAEHQTTLVDTIELLAPSDVKHPRKDNGRY